MLKELAIFGAGLVIGALGASYTLGFLDDDEDDEPDCIEMDDEESAEDAQTA